MRSFPLGLAAALVLVPATAYADPLEEARGATGACLAAIIDHAPVEDVDGDDVVIRRGKDPVSCTVRVDAGAPVVIRDAVLQAITRRAEHFTPARSKWDPAEFATRETFCALPSRRNVMAIVSTGKPDASVVLTATVVEAEKRDPRCDQDLGMQTIAAAATPPSAASQTQATSAAAEPIKLDLPPAKPEKKKKGWLPRLPGLGKKG
jgi:hypothetical protein